MTIVSKILGWHTSLKWTAVNEKEPGLMWFDSLVLSGCFTSEGMKGKQPERKEKFKFL